MKKYKITGKDGRQIVHILGVLQKDSALCGADLDGDDSPYAFGGGYKPGTLTREKVDCPHCIAIVNYCKKLTL